MPKNKAELEEKPKDCLDLLPEELWLKIISYLEEPKDLLSVSESCKTLKNAAQDESLWVNMNKRYGVSHTEFKGAKNNFIPINKMFEIALNMTLKIERRLNQLLSEIDWNPASLAATVQRLGYPTSDPEYELIYRDIEKYFNKELKNANLLFNYISKSTYSPRVWFQDLEPGIRLEDLFYNEKELDQLIQVIQVASECYEYVESSHCLMLSALGNIIENEIPLCQESNGNKRRRVDENESELEGCSSSYSGSVSSRPV